MDTFSIIFDIVRLVVFVFDIVLVIALIYTFPKAWAFRPRLFAERHVSPKKVYMVRSEALRNRWTAAAKRFSTGAPDAMRVAIVEADAIVDSALKEMGLAGEHMADRLSNVTADDVATIEGVWRSHRMRNDVVHTPTFSISTEGAAQTMEGYRAFLEEIGILEGGKKGNQ